MNKALLLIGAIAGTTAALVWRQRRMATHPIPVQQAAATLKQAWADYHTVA